MTDMLQEVVTSATKWILSVARSCVVKRCAIDMSSLTRPSEHDRLDCHETVLQVL
jgi:hypothetical protein